MQKGEIWKLILLKKNFKNMTDSAIEASKIWKL